jgi:hypothetical protein
MTWVRGTCVHKSTLAPSPECIMAPVPTERRPCLLHHLYPFCLHLHPLVHCHHPVLRYSCHHCLNPHLPLSCLSVCCRRHHQVTCYIPCHYRLQSPFLVSCRRSHIPISISSPSLSLLPCISLSRPPVRCHGRATYCLPVAHPRLHHLHMTRHYPQHSTPRSCPHPGLSIVCLRHLTMSLHLSHFLPYRHLDPPIPCQQCQSKPSLSSAFPSQLFDCSPTDPPSPPSPIGASSLPPLSALDNSPTVPVRLRPEPSCLCPEPSRLRPEPSRLHPMPSCLHPRPLHLRPVPTRLPPLPPDASLASLSSPLQLAHAAASSPPSHPSLPLVLLLQLLNGSRSSPHDPPLRLVILPTPLPRPPNPTSASMARP